MHPRIHAASQPDALALIMAESGETVSYAELEARVISISSSIRHIR
ncbi:MAG: hypothetical protein ABIM50_10255 [Novosphingobium sp.]